MHYRRVIRVIVGTVLVAAAPGVLGAQAPAAPVSPPTEPSLSRSQMAEFLASARIVGDADIPMGVTHPVRLTLDDGHMRHDAAFSTIDEKQQVWKGKDGRTELDFVDLYPYTIAAYAVAELVGLDGMMPVTIERRWEQHRGALSWWIDTLMTEGARLKNGVRAPDPEGWNDQVHRMRVFAQLVGDTDRNVGNILIDHQWKLWMIDFTRAFRRTHQLLNVNELQRCDRQLLERLRALTKEQLTEKTKSFIGGAEIDALLARRALIVARFEQLVTERGEARVLY